MDQLRKPMQIAISLGELTARGGQYQTVFRSTLEDKEDVDRAAQVLSMSSAQFIRMVVIQAARKVLAETV